MRITAQSYYGIAMLNSVMLLAFATDAYAENDGRFNGAYIEEYNHAVPGNGPLGNYYNKGNISPNLGHTGEGKPSHSGTRNGVGLPHSNFASPTDALDRPHTYSAPSGK